MSINSKIAELRKAKNLTQEQLAAKLYVTRQAVSRWENGETTPGIDMTKLLANALDVPITELMEMPLEGFYCQNCGMPMFDDADRATEQDGTLSADWCALCGVEGSERPGETMEELIERCAPLMVESGAFQTVDEAVSLLGGVLPQLKRWRA